MNPSDHIFFFNDFSNISKTLSVQKLYPSSDIVNVMTTTIIILDQDLVGVERTILFSFYGSKYLESPPSILIIRYPN